MAYIDRQMEERITELSKTWSAILLTGSRQSGKTTMLKKLAERENGNREYVSLDDLIIEGDGKLCPLEIKKTASPDKRIIKTFSLIDKSPLVPDTSAVLCMSDRLSAFDSNNLIVPIWMI